MKTARVQDAFTLIELLAVLAVVAVLAGLLLPGLGRAKEKARLTTCVNNLRQMAVGIKLYIDDNSSKYPPNYVIDDDGRGKQLDATLGGHDPLPSHAPYWASAKRRPLYDYMRPSDVYRCPVDKGQVQRRPCIYPNKPPLKPSNFETIGCSYQYNAADDWLTREGGGLKFPRDGVIAGQSESWVPSPNLFILMYEPPAQVYGCSKPFWSQWHYVRGKSDITDPHYTLERFISPILFVDGHVSVHNFTKLFVGDFYFPWEATEQWVWYKPLIPEGE